MKKISFLGLFFILIATGNWSIAKENVIKNIILMIPDGTSLATVSSARWYQWYNNPANPSLNIDPYLCGTVLTFSSNAPIGDSAPTTSCYMTGIPSRSGYVATYPEADMINDIYPSDSTKAFQPLMTLLEAAKITKNMSTGLVFTCEFPHATPADCSAHSYNRSKYEWIAPQMVHNDIDVVIGGGASILNDECKNYLFQQGYGLFLDDISNFRTYPGNKMWALFGKYDMPYDIDRDKTQYPSLSEMTSKAIEKLSTNQNGFFLMVEGSKIDWAAHANDPVAMITDLLAFDKACGAAIDFAKENGETIVIILPDHGNSGISLGSSRCSGYDKITKDGLFKTVSQYKITASGLIELIHKTEPSKIKEVFKEYMNLDLSDENQKEIMACEDYSKSNLTNEERMKGSKLNKTISGILNENTCFGFTTTGHTGEEVFLAIYDPTGNRPTGLVRNFQINGYMAKSLNLEGKLPELTESYFAKHTDVFNGYKYTITTQKQSELPVLVVNNKKNKLEIFPNTNIVKRNGKEIKLNSVIVYVDKNKIFYLPETLKSLLN